MKISGVVTGILAVLAGATAAAAADMPVKARPVPAPVHQWTGFYLGGHLGYGWGTADLFDPAANSSVRTSVDGILGGAQIGYNYQTGAWVFGVEADLSLTDIAGNTRVVAANGDVSTSNPRLRWTSLVTGRIGYVWGPALLYVKGGAAFAKFHYYADDITNGTTAATNINRTGWTVGGGLEYALNSAWSVRGEYDYLDFNRKNFGLVDSTGTPATLALTQPLHEVRFGLNYRFNGLPW